MSTLKKLLRRIPLVSKIVGSRLRPFKGSQTYWEERYALGGNSGAGSYGKFSEFKADVINSFVRENGIHNVIEFGSGDGHQLSLAEYPQYTGFDVSKTSIDHCRKAFTGDATKEFFLVDDYNGQKADLTLSLDVIYHLVEDDVFEDYMRRLFDAALRFVIVYSSDSDEYIEASHVQHRKFTGWVEKNVGGWSLERHIPNDHPFEGDNSKGSFADFFIYQKEK